ncbi:MAG: glycosyltransferase family 2 protein [Acidobacteriia bacterium]|nr:glycosyltransferase family 2 protein [Terriglobia bacterium]
MSKSFNFADYANTPEEERPVLSVVTPAYNESANLPLMYERLVQALDAMKLDWEWVVVDDHSADDTFAVLCRLSAADARVRAVRLARNFGSHMAITCGLHGCRGQAAVIMASDLQDPPEVIPDLLSRWREGDQVVWAVRRRREGETVTTTGFSRLYYWLMRHIVGIREMPASGADFMLLDRRVIDAFLEFREANVSILALLTWMGFRQGSILYDKQARQHGRSGWTLKKKLKLVVDSVTSFTYAPIRAMSYVGFAVAVFGLMYAGFILVYALRGNTVPGWSSLMIVVLVIGGVQMVMLGVLGEYLWRALDESRQRPRYLVEASTAELARARSALAGSVREER